MLPDLIEARSVVVRWRAERGDSQKDLDVAEDLAALARRAGTLPLIAAAFAAAAQALLAEGRLVEARVLLAELDDVRAGRSDPLYAALVPHVVRLALVLREPALALQLVEGVEPRTPLAEHSLTACRAQLAEAAGDHAEAAALYAEAAERWREFGNVPERAYALLGHGRCLAAFGRDGAEVAARRSARRCSSRRATSPPSRKRTGCSSKYPHGPLRQGQLEMTARDEAFPVRCACRGLDVSEIVMLAIG